MNSETKEHLSSLMDGEISRETGLFLVRRLGSDEELSATWARYHLVRDCLRHHEGSLAASSLQGRVSRALDRESAVRSASPARARWLKPAAGLAVAASVALMAIVAVSPEREAVVPGATEAATAPAFTSPQSLTPAPMSQQASLAGQRGGDHPMNAYLLRHYQATGSAAGRGFVTFVPIVITSTPVRDESSTAEPDKSAQDESSAR